jgi:hypothetical protein
MGTTTFVQDFRDGLEFTPVDGQPSVFVIHVRRSDPQLAQEGLTSEDWDKFEENIKELRAR